MIKRNLRELLFLHFLNDGVRTTFIILLPFIAKDLGINFAQVGFLGSSQPLFASLLALPAGFLALRFGGFHLLLSVLLVYSLGSLGVSFSPNFFWLVPAFYLGAIGFGMFHTIGFTLIAKISDKKNIGRNMGDFTSIGDIGRIALPPLAVFMTSLVGWRLTMLGIALVGVVFWLYFQLFPSSREIYSFQDNTPGENYRDFVKNALYLLKSRKFFLVALTSILDSMASSPIFIFLPFLILAKGISPAQLGIISGAFFVGSLFGKSGLGRLVDKIGNSRVFILSELAMSLMLILITLFSSFFPLLFFSLILGIFTKGTSPVVQTIFSELTHQDHYNKVYAISEISIGLAGMLALIIMGVVADRFGAVTIFYISAVLGFFAILPIYKISREARVGIAPA